MIRKLLLCSLVLSTMARLSAQDIHFSQYMYAPLSMNPAMTGLFNGDYRAVTNYRSQWFTVPVSYNTFSASFDARMLPYKMEKDIWGVGGSFMHDQAGDAQLSKSSIQFSSAYAKRISSSFFISGGLQFSYAQRRFDLEKLTFDDQFNGDVFDPSIVSADLANLENSSIRFFDMGVGLNFRYQKSSRLFVNIGGATHNLLMPKQSFMGEDIRLPMRFTLNGDASIKLSERLDLLPSFLLQFQGQYREYLATTSMQYHLNQNPGREMSVYLGVGHRVGDAMIVMTGFAYQTWHVGFSYDINISDFKVATANNGGFELSLIYIWRKVPELGKVKICPIL